MTSLFNSLKIPSILLSIEARFNDNCPIVSVAVEDRQFKCQSDMFDVQLVAATQDLVSDILLYSGKPTSDKKCRPTNQPASSRRSNIIAVSKRWSFVRSKAPSHRLIVFELFIWSIHPRGASVSPFQVFLRRDAWTTPGRHNSTQLGTTRHTSTHPSLTRSHPVS
jgi:hypothetical protein